jgi:hypothetical protein
LAGSLAAGGRGGIETQPTANALDNANAQKAGFMENPGNEMKRTNRERERATVYPTSICEAAAVAPRRATSGTKQE